jgi:D-amino peptidase
MPRRGPTTSDGDLRVLVSVDMEGIASIVGWDDTLEGRSQYERCRELLTDEANAAVRGVLQFAPDSQVLVADAHAAMRNVIPERLDRRARLLRGSPKADSMLSGITSGIDAVLFAGYHGQSGTWQSVLAHTMNGSVILDVRCNGRSLGEIGLNIAHAAAHGATTVLVTGDDTAAAEASDVADGIHTVVVKWALGGWAAECLHPEEACDRIEAAVPAALAARDRIEPLQYDGPVDLEVDFVRPVMAEPFLLIPGMERCSGRGLRYHAPDFTTAYGILELIAALGITGE